MGLSIKIPKIDEIKHKLNYNKISVAIALLVFIIGFGFACSAIYYVVFDINRNKNAIRTQATVQKVEFVNNNYLLNIEYELDNKVYENTMVYEGDSVTLNDKVAIKYNGKNPYDIITTNHNKQIIICTPIAVIFITVSIMYIVIRKRKAKRLERLKQNGILIYADIEGIFANNNAKKKKGKLPYYIKAVYQTPDSQQQSTYFSANHYEDLLMLTTSKTITKVPIYINPKNPSDYHMDLIYILPEDKNE